MATDLLNSLDLRKDLFWATRLVECMNEMGDEQTNAVLLSLEGARSVKPFQRYPETPYYFGSRHWRAYYHCHDSAEKLEGEHGHFHFYTRSNAAAEWCHVVAMGMNDLGQPVRLFTTNLWVTGGGWFAAEKLEKQSAFLGDDRDLTLATEWIRFVLILFQREINALLLERDRTIERQFGENTQSCYADREIYCLSSSQINLNKRLLEIFSPIHE